MAPEVLDDIEACFAAGWTDGRPVVPPTRERVERMLGPWAARRNELVAVLAPGQGRATVEKIAANAVMAGCLPEHLPVVLEAVRAIAEDRFPFSTGACFDVDGGFHLQRL